MRPLLLRTGLLAGTSLISMAGPAWSQQAGPSASADQPVQLRQVAEFPHQVTGVTVTKDGRIFVNSRAGRKTRRSPWPRSGGTAA